MPFDSPFDSNWNNSPFGGDDSWWNDYIAGGISPALILSYYQGKYYNDGTSKDFPELVDSAADDIKSAWMPNGGIGWRGHNYITQSTLQSGWGAGNLATITPNQVTAPDGSLTGAEVYLDSGSIASQIYQLAAGTTGGAITISAWVKSDSGSENFRFSIWNTVDLVQRSADITAPTSWTLVSFEVAISKETTVYMIRQTAAVSSTIHVWGFHVYRSDYGGMQLNEDGSTYFPTTSAAYYAPAVAYDPASLVRTGHVQELALNRLNTYPVCKKTAGWLNTNVTSTDLSLDVFGVFNGVEVTSTGNALGNLAQTASVTYTAADVHYFDVYYRAGTSGNLMIKIRDTTAAVNSLIVGAAGSLAVTLSSAGAISGLREVLLSDGVTYRVTGYITAALSGDYGIYLGPSSSSAGETVIALGAFAGGAGEKLPHCPIIGDDGSTFTTAADIPTLDAGSEPFVGFDGSQGTWVFKGAWAETGGTTYQLVGGASERFIYQTVTTGAVRTYDGTTAVTKSGVLTDDTSIAVVQSYLEGGNFNILADGSTESSAALTGDLATTTIDIGHLAGANGMHGVIHEIIYYPVQLDLATRQGFEAND